LDVGGHVHTVRQRSPWKAGLSLDSLSANEFIEVVEQIAALTATSHTRGSVGSAPMQFKEVISAALGSSYLARVAWSRSVVAFAAAYREQVLLDYGCFREWYQDNFSRTERTAAYEGTESRDAQARADWGFMPSSAQPAGPTEAREAAQMAVVDEVTTTVGASSLAPGLAPAVNPPYAPVRRFPPAPPTQPYVISDEPVEYATVVIMRHGERSKIKSEHGLTIDGQHRAACALARSQPVHHTR
jgi:hypothetical protein